MSRNVARLDPKVLEGARDIVFNTKLTQNQMVTRIRRETGVSIDRRWIAELRRYYKMVEQGLEEAVHSRPGEKAKLSKAEELFEAYRKLATAQIPVAERVKLLRKVFKEGKLSERMKALDKLDALEGIGKDKKLDRQPVPLFQITATEEPDFRKQDYRVDNDVDLWADDWSIYNPEDGTVSIMVSLGNVEDEEAQKYLRALTSGANIGIRGRKTARSTVDKVEGDNDA